MNLDTTLTKSRRLETRYQIKHGKLLCCITPDKKKQLKKKTTFRCHRKTFFHIHGPVVMDLREEVQKVNNPSKIEKKDQKKAVNKTTSLRSWRDYLREVRAAELRRKWGEAV